MIYVARSDCVSCDHDDGVAVLDLRSNIYFTLDEVGGTIWDCLVDGADRDALVQTVVKEYDVTADVCQPDIEVLLKNLIEHDLIVEVP